MIKEWFSKLTWQDWVTIISLIISVFGLGVSIASLILTGHVKHAVAESKKQWLSKTKYNLHRGEYIRELTQLINKLKDDAKSKYSSGDIKGLFLKYNEIVKYLSECTEHLNNKHKQVVEECFEYILKSRPQKHIYTQIDCEELLEYVLKLLNILKQEDYFI